MIRRNSIVIFVVFLILLGGILYINQDSNLQTSLGMQTATATQQPKVITDVDLGTLKSYEFSSVQGLNVKVAPNEKGEWFTDKKEPVNIQTMFQATDGLINLRGTISSDQTVPLDKIGLNPSQAKLVLSDQKGNHGTLYIGNQTVTKSDYYVKWENNPVTLISSSQIDSLLSSFAPDKLIAATPAPNVTPTP
jgi:hypothetical protein